MSNKVTLQQLASIFVKFLPIEGEEFDEARESVCRQLRKLPQEHLVALQSAYIFSHKVPFQEREDLFQELYLTILEHDTKDERLAYAIARCDWKDWWEKYKTRQHYSLDMVIDEDSRESFGDLLVGEIEFENRLNGDLEGKRIFDLLPVWVQKLVTKYQNGDQIRCGERKQLSNWVATKPMILAGYQS